MNRLGLTVALLVMTLAGCASRSGAGVSGRGDDQAGRNQTEWESIAAALRKTPGVLRLDGGYRKDASNPGGTVVLSITVEPGTELRDVADETVRRVWLSRLDPITSATITVGPRDNPKDAIDQHVDFKLSRDRDDLTTRYGPRPTT
jgi:hypothetical protein